MVRDIHRSPFTTLIEALAQCLRFTGIRVFEKNQRWSLTTSAGQLTTLPEGNQASVEGSWEGLAGSILAFDRPKVHDLKAEKQGAVLHVKNIASSAGFLLVLM